MISIPCQSNQFSPIFVSTLLSCNLKRVTQHLLSLATHDGGEQVILRRLLTPGLWSVLSCRPNRLLPCIGEAVAEDSRLGDWAILGEFGVEVSAPLSARRCSSLCCCCCRSWHTTTCCSWWVTEKRQMHSDWSLLTFLKSGYTRNINCSGFFLFFKTLL